MLQQRRNVVVGVMLLVGLIYIVRLFYLQIVDKNYAIISTANSIRRVIEVPHRGQIYDRHGKLLAYNTSVYELLVTPAKVSISDTLTFCRLLGIERLEFDSLMAEAKSYSPIKASPFLSRLTKEEYASIQDAMVDYPGFEFIRSYMRAYPMQTLANTLGYVSEISQEQLENQKESYYRRGDKIGQTGLERYYEPQLRGEHGVNFQMVNVNGIPKGSWKGGSLDSAAVAGADLYTSIDLELQQYADSLLVNKVGSVVAIEPATGQILAITTAPTYDPNLLSNRYFSKNYGELSKNPYKPLFNRPVMASYRPGSTFKIMEALVALQHHDITPQTGFGHAGSPMRCHLHPYASTPSMALQYSCNPYFYFVFRKMIFPDNDVANRAQAGVGLDQWHQAIRKFGIGQRLGIDLPSEYRGILPDKEYYDKRYGKKKWRFSNIYSLSIGEGELLINPLKMANVAAIVANKGYFYTPHIVKGIGSIDQPLTKYSLRHEVGIDSSYFEPIVKGMVASVDDGTVMPEARIRGIAIAGKTGTSQNRTGKDHSIYIAFAPAGKPTIAIAVFVENAGFGGSHAAPIANLIIEKYLKRKVENKRLEDYVLKQDYLPEVLVNGKWKKWKADTSLFKKTLEPAVPKAGR